VEEIKQGNFEGWAVVEMMGHRQEIGFVTTEAYGGAVLFRVDTPELPEREYVLTKPEFTDSGYSPAGSKVKRSGMPARSCLVAPGSLYALNPCTQEAAIAAIDRSMTRRLILVELPAGALIEPPALDIDLPIVPGHFDEDDRFGEEHEV
jgi:hypothetical protein